MSRCQSCGQEVEIQGVDREHTVCDNCDALLDVTEKLKKNGKTYLKAKVMGNFTKGGIK